MLTKRRRGRPPRAGVRASRRVELRLTGPEHDVITRLARANGISLADVCRLGALHVAAALEEDGADGLVLGGRLLIPIRAPDAPLVDLLPAVNPQTARKLSAD